MTSILENTCLGGSCSSFPGLIFNHSSPDLAFNPRTQCWTNVYSEHHLILSNYNTIDLLRVVLLQLLLVVSFLTNLYSKEI